MNSLDGRQKLSIHWLDTGAINSLNRSLNLAFIDLFECIERVVRDFGACCSLSFHLGRGLRRGVCRGLMRCRRLLIDAILGEDIVQIRALRRVVDDLEGLLHFAADQYWLRASRV